MSDDLLDIEQAAAYLRCSTKSLRRMVADKQLPERRIRSRKLMFIPHELDAVLLKTGTAPATSISSTLPAALLSDDEWIAARAGVPRPQKAG